ncbi:unnamed protein product [Paramecium sonneborni]|uniref:Transmembrane protein n=1 Tax=Paramecium sonneborni TaxID=65129 RepID=A0A8S1MJB3_9CILI|nr:unnamed protein product [Paramecium sonneborni]
MISLIPFLILSLDCSYSFIVELSQDYQFQIEQLNLQNQDFGLNQYFTYGLWSKYIPLGQISQIGRIGIFDSNCFHLHNAADSQTMKVDLIYFDCLDSELMQITKGIQFYDNFGNFHSYNITLDQWEYESHWYYFQIAQQPVQQRFELHFIYYPDIIFSKILNIKYPYRSVNPYLTFGGGLILNINNDFFENIQGRKQLSYFPGKLYYDYLFVDFKQIDRDELKTSIDTFQDLYKCHCQTNLNMKVQNDILNWLDNKLFTSENANCESFGLSGWLRILEIHQINDNFDYKFIKMNKFSQNQKLNDDNLSAFQLLYRLSDQKFKIVIMTYSYNFPSVNIDFSKNPFVIKKEIEILNEIYFWHYLQVTLNNNNLQITITFYEGENQFIYQASINVYHFNEVQFQIHYGNINQQSENYLNVKIENFLFYNCDNQLLDKSCHPSCEKCDGPTNSDCLSCSQDSNRIYIPQHKACVCHYNAIDQDFCYQKEHFNFKIQKQQQKTDSQNICQYGYFNLNSQICIKCPSIIKTNHITCLECIQNPINWKNDPYCQTILYIIGDNTFNTSIDEKKSYYILVDDEVQICSECTQGNFNDDLQMYQDFSSSIQLKKEFCQKNYSIHQIGFQNQLCYNCQISLCRVCVIQIDGNKCLACDYGTSLKDGICLPVKVGQENNLKDCVSPFYRASNKQCKICTIKYCKFCFEYESNDLSKSTLYKDYEEFNQDENHKIGCALCEENFIFDFRKGFCIHQKSMIQYCQRSFINQLGEEICTLSQIDDFRIAPEIINCQKYITNCLQCVLSPQQIIKCVICQDGYKNSVKTGHCYLSSIPHCKTCSEGITNPFDAWVQLIQSFLMQFLPNQYYYYVQDITTRQIEITIECMEGFRLTSNLCFKTCQSDCLSCQDSLDEFTSIECMKCPLNYYRQPNRSKDKGICLLCPQLCQICQLRSKEEIQMVNPEFIINQNNAHFSYKCLQPVFDPNIKINSQSQIAKYCFTNQCEDQFQYEYLVDCLNLHQGLIYGTASYYQQNINKTYLNNMGIEIIQIIFNFTMLGFETNCFYLGPIKIDNNLKEEVFSLQIVKIKIMGLDQFNTKIYDNLIINNFYVVEITQIQFQVDLPFYINLNSKSVTLIIEETIFEGKIGSIQSQFQIIGQLYSDFILKNVTFQNLLIIESYMFNIKYNNTRGTVLIENLLFINCTFTNSSFIYFTGNPDKIILINLQFINCQFYNSLNFIFFDNVLGNYLINLQQFLVSASTFKQSILINYPYDSELVIQDLDIFNNSFIFSTFIICNSKAIYNNLAFRFNYLTESFFLISNQVNQTDDINIDFQNIEIYNNSIKNSSIIKLTSNLLTNSYNITLSNITILDNQNQLQSDQKYYLFYIHAQALRVSSVIIKDCPNHNFFYLFQINDIIIQDILFTNSRLKSKVPLSLSCLDSIKQNQQLLKIQGFQKLKLINLSALNHFNIDQALIQIFSNMIQQSDVSESINIQNLTFQKNILLKKEIENLLSLIAIYSEQTQIIQISNIKFIENIYNQYSDDLSSSSSSLFYINSQFSQVILYDCFFYNNMLTNSFNSFASIQSNNTFIQNFTAKNLNIITQDVFKSYYKIEFLEKFTQDEILLIIKSYLKIRNKRGVLQITASSFSIQDSNFENVLAQSSAIFEITTKSVGVVSIKQITLKNIQVDFTQNLDIYGSICIFSENSQLQFELSDVNFIDVYNKFGSSSLTLFPSMKQNILVFKNIYLENSLSLMNSFTKLEFQQQEINFNSIIIQNMTVIQTLEAWINYFTFAGTLSIIEMLKILYDNAIINIFGCPVKIIGLNVQGVLFSSVLKVIDAQQFYLAETYFNSISTFLSINMIYIGQDRLKKYQLFIYQIEFDSYSQFESIQKQIILTNLIPLNKQFSQCSLTIKKSHFIQQNLSLNSILKQLNLNLQQSNTGSMIFIQSQTNQTKLLLNSLIIKNNNFLNCGLGVIYFEIQNFNQIKMNNILCYLNKILKNGCITFISNSTLQTSIIIQNSQFIRNTGTQGSGIISQNINIKILNCIFLKNNASLMGGAIYIGSNSNQVQFLKTIIMENEAKIAGGIYLNGNSSLNQNNFNKSILQLNKAYKNSNNLFEIPNHLGLQINDQEMSFSESLNQGIITSTLKLNSYQTIQQGKSLITNYLMIPSNQQIGNYGLFKIQEMDYFVQIKNISLSFRNSMNELLNNVEDYICELSQTIVSQDEIISKEEKFLQILYLNNQSQKFDFGTQIFQIDPYLDYNKQLQIQIDCIFRSSYKQLRYIIYAKSYLCQLGEYYVEKGCQKCQSIQGYYSVIYNATKCSIFDNVKFQNITSNLISLNPGYWRPDYFSDQTEQCFKNQIFCQGGWEVGDQLCLKGHIGGLCEECDIYNIRGFGEHYKSLTNNQCEICPKLSINLILFIFVTLWYKIKILSRSFLSIFLSVRSIEKTNLLYSSLSLKQKFRGIIFKLNQDHQSFLIKMLLNYLWLFSLIYSFNINFSFSNTFFESASNSSFVLAYSLDCYLSSQINTNIVYSRIITMIIIILFLFIFFVLANKLYSIFKKLKFRMSVVTNTILYLYLSNNSTLIKNFCSLLAIRKISNIDFIQGNVSLLFNTQTHFKWIIGFILPGLIFVGAAIPVFLLMLMYFRKEKLQKIQFRRHICYLFNEYNQNTYFWEQIKIWKKTLVIFIMIYFETNILLKASLLGLCLLLYQSLALKYRPFILNSLNVLDISTSQLCSISIFLAAVQYVSDQQNHAISFIIQVILILLWIKLCKPFILKILSIYYKKYRIMFLSKIQNLVKKIKQNSCLVLILNKQIIKWKTKEKSIKQNYGKLKMYLICFSKLSLESHKNMNSQLLPLQTLRSRISYRENDTKQLF